MSPRVPRSLSCSGWLVRLLVVMMAHSGPAGNGWDITIGTGCVGGWWRGHSAVRRRAARWGWGMAGMPVLRISDVPLGGGRRRVEVTWQDGPARQVVVSTFAYQAGDAEAEKVRWYLEDYPEFPADPGPAWRWTRRRSWPARALACSRRCSPGWTRRGSGHRRGPGWGGCGWRWIPTRPRRRACRGSCCVTRAPTRRWRWARESSCAPTCRPPGRVSVPEAAGDRLRVLLVICRPGRGEDVPFRSVASRLVRGGAEQMEGLDLDVLRPATFARLTQVLHEAADAGRPTTWCISTATAPTSTSPHSPDDEDEDGDWRPTAGQRHGQRGGGGGGSGCRRCGTGSRWPGRCGPGSTGT